MATDTPGKNTATYETNSGLIVLLGDRAWKFKKPIRTDFLDFSTVARREQACHRETELNRRLAPDVYLGVGSLRGADDQDAEPVVTMARMPHDRRLSAIAADEGAGFDEVRSIARIVATFHHRADRSETISAAAERDAVRERWDGIVDGLRQSGRNVIESSTIEEIEYAVHRFLHGRQSLFRERIDAGRVIDGHGDMLADDVFCLPDGPCILDCIEFDDHLRWVDGIDDIACLAMHLEYDERPDLAQELVDSYTDFAGDPAPVALRHHYMAYRATVRARVACLQSDQTGDPGEVVEQEARRYVEIALQHLRQGATRLVLVGGLPGTGKTTTATGLGGALGANVLSSDPIRKELAGLDPRSPVPRRYRDGLYAPQATEQVYAQLIERAEHILRRGESLILDASWTSTAHRQRALELADRTSSELTALWCETPHEVATTRLRNRTDSASDADQHVATAMAIDTPPWPEAWPLPTNQPHEQVVEQALAHVRRR